MRWLPQKWNDTLSLVVVVGVPFLWVFGHLPDVLIGQTVAGWLTVIYFYFRKREQVT